MSRIVVVATAGAGGDLQPLIAAAIALRTRGHDIQLLGDRTVEPAVAGLGMSVRTLPPELDLGPALIGAIRDAMSATGGDLNSAGPLVQQRITAWAKAVARPVADALLLDGPDAVVTSLFGVEVLHLRDAPRGYRGPTRRTSAIRRATSRQMALAAPRGTLSA